MIVRASLLGLALAGVAGCGGEEGRAELRVLAAASLTEAFDELERTYESDHPDVDVALSYDSSASLAAQVLEGVPADVLATADTQTMDTVVDAGLVAGEPVPFATNTLVLVTPPDNPAGIGELADLTGAGVLFASCVPSAPCGDAAQRLLDVAGVGVQAVTEEDNVKGVLTKVIEGEVDAGLVYASDAEAAGGEVTVVPVPETADVVNVDPIAVLADSEQPDAAADWVELVLSRRGQAVLTGLGFGPAR